MAWAHAQRYFSAWRRESLVDWLTESRKGKEMCVEDWKEKTAERERKSEREKNETDGYEKQMNGVQPCKRREREEGKIKRYSSHDDPCDERDASACKSERERERNTQNTELRLSNVDTTLPTNLLEKWVKTGSRATHEGRKKSLFPTSAPIRWRNEGNESSRGSSLRIPSDSL